MVSEKPPASGESWGNADGNLAGFFAGTRLAGYRLEEQVGAGGMAMVFRAVDERLDRLVALKVLAPAVAWDEAFRQRFIRESRVAAAIDDPHILPVYEAGQSGGVLFIAMRYVPGGDVSGLLRRGGPLPPDRAAAIISPVALALDAAHAAGLVHRDVKPANMLLDVRPGRPDHVYLSDFGISKAAVSSAGLTGSGYLLGTPAYTAPEQLQGQPVDGRTDQYALACAAFEMLTGHTPFQRDEAAAVMWAQLSAPPPSVTVYRPELAAAADQVFARALAKKPADRYLRCADFADALRQALGLAPYHAGPVSPGAADVRTPGAEEPADAMIPARPAPSAATGPAVLQTGEPTLGQAATRAFADPESATKPSADATAGQDTTRPHRRRGRGKAIAVGVGGAALLAAGIAAAVAFLGSSHQNGGLAIPADVLSGGSYGFSNPAGIAADGTHIWVANAGGYSVTELNGSDGGWVQTLSGGRYGFSNPAGIAADGTHIWVANAVGNSVTELNGSDGSWVRTSSGGRYGFSQPRAIAIEGGHVWVTNTNGNSVTELNGSDGSLVRILSGSSYGFNGPAGIATEGTQIWVTNSGGNSVTRLTLG
jgi:serine/threonine-protein kinase